MKPRERVLAALDHREPDVAPIDFGGHRSSGINAMAYGRLKKALGITSGHVYVYDMVQQLAIVEPAVLDAFGVDCIELGRGFMQDDAEWQDWTLPDGTACKIPGYVHLERRGGDTFLKAEDGRDLSVQKAGSVFFEQVFWPMAGRAFEPGAFEDLPEIFNKSMWTGIPAPGAHFALDDAGLARLAAGARALRESSDRAIIGLFGGNMFEAPQFLFGMDKYFTYMALYPEACDRLSEVLYEMYAANLEKWMAAVGPYLDVVLFGDDLGGQNGPLISKAMYRRYYKPYHQKLWRRAKQLADVKVLLHSCGGIEPLLDDLIEAGVDAVNPVQISCKGMDPRALKDKYGDRLTLWGGGCDTHAVLPGGDPAAVRAHVKKQVEILAPGGGFVFQQVHNIMSEVQPANIIAMFEAVRNG
ncbi:MAG TPA: uroporphyrinogen decarboxylase family protein [bacterium]|nr:uroporphyrinogen decarboxylase family protein [bacterium]